MLTNCVRTSFMSNAATNPPRSARRNVVALPRPELAPVTYHTWPETFMLLSEQVRLVTVRASAEDENKVRLVGSSARG